MVLKMSKVTGAVLVLLVAITLPQLSAGSSKLRQDLDPSSCSAECKKRASSTDTTLSVIGSLLSFFVSLSPAMRVFSKFGEQDNAKKKYRWFMAFLALVTLDSAVWVGYSFKGCQYCDATVFMIMNSLFGAIFSCLWALIGLVRDRGCIVADQVDKITLTSCCLGVVVMYGIESYHSNNSGYYALAGAVVAHLCRCMGTDYRQFSGLQLIVSTVGVVAGFLCIRHPDLDAAQPFWHSTAVIAGIRGLELVWWMQLYIRSIQDFSHFLQDVRGVLTQACAYAGLSV